MGHNFTIQRRRTALQAGVSLLCLGIALSSPAFSQDTPQDVTVTESGRVYDAEFFTAYSPKTAEDMLRNVPGFSVRRFGSRGRGLGAGGVNVLINGAQIRGKSADPIEILQRTSASSVQRIEITNAAKLGLSGISGDVANVIIERAKPTWTAQWNSTFRRGLKPSIKTGELSVSGTKGNFDYTIGLEHYDPRSGNKGPKIVTDSNGLRTEFRHEDTQFLLDETNATIALGYTNPNDIVANFNATYNMSEGGFDEIRKTLDSAGINSYRSFNSDFESQSGEISGDIQFPALGGKLKLISLRTLRKNPGENASISFIEGNFDSARQSSREGESGETIFRAELDWPKVMGGSFQVSAERAFNYLENASQSVDLDENGLPIGDISIDDTTRVEEERSELGMSYARSFGEKISIQASLGIDYSTLSQPDSTIASRDFVRPKGTLSAAYSANENTTWRAQIERRQGQLNFGTFVSSVSLDDDRRVAGNDGIVPEQTWFGELELERRFGEKSSVTFSIFGESFEDVVDRIAFDTDGDGLPDTDGPGNIETASRFGARVTGTVTTDRIGIKGGDINFGAFAQETSVDDPITGERRDFSGSAIYRARARFRQRIPNTDWEYGVGIFNGRQAANYNFGQYFRDFRDADTFVFIKHNDVHGATINVVLGNLTNAVESTERIRYVGPRQLSAIDFTERSARTFGQILRVNIKKTF